MACADTARLVCIGNVVDAGEKTHVLLFLFFNAVKQARQSQSACENICNVSLERRKKKKGGNSRGAFVPCCVVF